MLKPADFKDIRRELIGRDPVPPLHPRRVWSKDLNDKITELDVDEKIRAGLYLWNDDIDRCHRIAQNTPDRDGNLWHAILHRRGGDYSNSKYWYRHVGTHPIFKKVQKNFTDWDPFVFVDRCEEAARGGKRGAASELEKIQHLEMNALLDYCTENATAPEGSG